MSEWDITYIASTQHLLGDILNAPLILGLTAAVADRVDVLEVGSEEFDVAAVGEAGVLVFRDLERGIVLGPAEVPQQREPEIGRIGYIGDLVQFVRHVDVHQVLQSRELNVAEPFARAQCSQRLTVRPNLLVRHTEEVLSREALVSCPFGWRGGKKWEEKVVVHTIIYQSIRDDH